MGAGYNAVQDRRIEILERKLEVVTKILSELLMPAKFEEMYSEILKVEDDVMREDSESD